MFVSERLLAFRTSPEEHKSPCRQRSESRLKNYVSCSDIRIWGLDIEDRRKAFLDLFRTCQKCPRFGNYVPMFQVLKAAGINLLKDQDSEPATIQLLRFIFNTLGSFFPMNRSHPDSQEGITIDKGKKMVRPKGDKSRLRQAHEKSMPEEMSALRYPEDTKQLQNSLYDVDPELKAIYSPKGEQTIEPKEKSARRLPDSQNDSLNRSNYPQASGYGHRQKRHLAMPQQTDTEDDPFQSSRDISEMSFLTGVGRVASSSINEQTAGRAGTPQAKTKQYAYGPSAHTLTDSSLDVGNGYTNYNKSRWMRNNRRGKDGRERTAPKHEHINSEMCAEMCAYLKEQLKQVNELVFQRDLLQKQLKYHEQNLPRKIRGIEEPERPMLHSGQSDSESTFFEYKSYSVLKHDHSTQNVGDSKKSGLSMKKSTGTKLTLLKSSVFTANENATNNFLGIESREVLPDCSGLQCSKLKEFDTFVKDVQQVLSEVLKKFDVKDETLQSPSEEILMATYSEYKLEVSQSKTITKRQGRR